MAMVLRQRLERHDSFAQGSPTYAAAIEREIDWDQPEMLVSLVDFKWLMAGAGCRVNLTRLRHDMDYANDCLRMGLGSDLEVLRERSKELLPRLSRVLTRRRQSLHQVRS